MENTQPFRAHLEVSVGQTIRQITSYLLDKYTQTIRTLSTQSSPETKREVLVKLIKNINDYVKILLKFTKNCRKFKKIKDIFLITERMYLYKDNIKFIIDQLYYTSEMCKFYRTPSFNVQSSIETINHKSHHLLKNDIYNELILFSHFNYAPKEVQADFIEKYLYNQSLKSEINYEGLFKESENILNIQEQLIQFLNCDDNSKIIYQDNMFWFYFNKLVLFKLMPFILQNTPEKKQISYFCKAIIFNKTHPAIVRNEQVNRLNQKLAEMNSLLSNEIIIDCNDDVVEDNVDLKLMKLKLFLKNFISQNILPFIFSFYKKKIFKLSKKYFIPLDIQTKEDIIIEFKPNNDLIDSELKDNLKITISPIYEDEIIKVLSSVYVVSYKPFIFVNNKEDVYPIDNLPYEKIISEHLTQFEEIVMNKIYEKLQDIQILFFKINFVLNNNNKKIDCVIENTFNLFSIILNSTGNLTFLDYDYCFNEDKMNKLSQIIIQYIKTGNIDYFQFNYLILIYFIPHFFSFSKISINIEKINGLKDSKFALNFTIPKFFTNNLNFKLVMIVNYIHSRNKQPFFNIQSETLYFYQKKDNQEKLKLNFNSFLKLSHSNFYIKVKSFEILVKEVEDYFLKNEEFFKNTMELITTYNLVDIPSAFREGKENSIMTVIENQNFEYFETIFSRDPKTMRYYQLLRDLVTKIEITNQNVIFKLYLNKNYLESKFEKPLQSYSLMEVECIAAFNQNDYCLTFCLLSKLKTSDLNSTKRLFTELLKKFLSFMENLMEIYKSEINFFLSDSNIIISPLCLLFKFPTQKGQKKICIQFQADSNSQSCYKRWILPNDLIFNEFDIDHNKLLNDNAKGTLFEKLRYYFLIDDVYDALTSHFLSYMICNTKINMHQDSFQRGIYVFVKDFSSFELFQKNGFSIYIEVYSFEIIKIYSNYPVNMNKTIALLDRIKKMLCNTSNNGNNVSEKNNIITIKNSNQKELFKELNIVINIIENFS